MFLQQSCCWFTVLAYSLAWLFQTSLLVSLLTRKSRNSHMTKKSTVRSFTVVIWSMFAISNLENHPFSKYYDIRTIFYSIPSGTQSTAELSTHLAMSHVPNPGTSLRHSTQYLSLLVIMNLYSSQLCLEVKLIAIGQIASISQTNN